MKHLRTSSDSLEENKSTFGNDGSYSTDYFTEEAFNHYQVCSNDLCENCKQKISMNTNVLEILKPLILCLIINCAKAISKISALKLYLYLSPSPTGTSMNNNIGLSKSIKLKRNIERPQKNMKSTEEITQRRYTELIAHKNSLERINEECSSLKSICKQQKADSNTIAQDQDALEKKEQKIKQLMEDSHYATYDGTLIWKITNFFQEITELQCRKKGCITSPLFYSSVYGYKMRACLALYKDDTGVTYVSLSLILLKGEYDAILSWPFNFSVHFCLFDQTGHDHHIVHSFQPDQSSVSFKRPISNLHDPSGIKKFCPLTIVTTDGNRYVRNDTMFIKIMVDPDHSPKAILPYTMSLNPALPTHVQESKRRMELKRFRVLRRALVAQIAANDQAIQQSGLLSTYRPFPRRAREEQLTPTTDLNGIQCKDKYDE